MNTAARGEYIPSRDGMSLRDFFAAHALATLINKCEDRDGGWCPNNVAAGAYLVADAMLRARREGSEQS